ncbi:MAG: sugar transferase [Anaerolineae bacterium]|nr:sugar transferase [Anaerolineae bacterium]MBT7071792.1 sugar transferase [Anaerolineae bacterium]MBT7324039.1 sugar transferase [Anaerolineae bacterium]
MPNIPRSKRAFDFLVAFFALIFSSPILLIVALLVRIFHGAPLLFKQQRPGYKGTPFFIYKFRTMTNRTAPDGNLLPDAERLTPFGRFLRATSLDELPELFNILRGEMSLVGPRPLLMQYLPLYNAEQMRRHDALPGITGWAQINGRNNISWDEKFRLDVWYVEHWSFGLDLKILWQTAWKVFKREGVNMDGEVTTKFFKGNDN